MFPSVFPERWSCALALAMFSSVIGGTAAQGQYGGMQPSAGYHAAESSPLFTPPAPASRGVTTTPRNYPYLLSSLPGAEASRTGDGQNSWGGPVVSQPGSGHVEPHTMGGEQWISATGADPYVDAEVYLDDSSYDPSMFSGVYPPQNDWFWQILPDGIIYRSYWAGVHEPRTSVVLIGERDGRSLWDATLGGRFGILRYGDAGTLVPQGWQLDVEAAALARLTLDDMRDMETVDYRGGVPLTYGIGNWQYKLAYYHLSSHLADEYAINHPGSLGDRVNYVRDAFVLGVSYYANPAWRLYGEAGYAFNADGGAEPWEFQFGTEYARPGVTSFRGTPFLALNGHLREENDFSGDVTAQAGWLWRGRSGQTMRLGAHYFNGKSSQYQTFDDSEEQVGIGLWYDF